MVFHLKKLTNALKRAAEGPVRLLYPEVCQVCFLSPATPSEGFVCDECQRGILNIKSPFCHRCGLPFDGEIQQEFQCPNCHDVRLHFVSARSACVANALMLDLLHRYKYGNARWLDPLFERILVDAVSNDRVREAWDAVAPVPLYSVRQRERGYNQSTFLAESVGVRLNLPSLEGAVKRIAHTPSQTMLNRKERATNVAEAFEVVDVDRIIESSGIVDRRCVHDGSDCQ
jgi:competence protein ComFC